MNETIRNFEEEPSFYAIIPANVRYDKDLTPNAKLLYGEITALCNKRGYCWATNDYFSKLYGVSKTSISKWISLLAVKNYIISDIIYKEGTKEIDKRCIRIVNDPIEEKLNTPIEEKLKDNNTSINTTINNTKKKERKTAGANTFDALIEKYSNGDLEVKELLQDWLKVRKAKRAAMTDRAIELNLQKMNKLATKSNLSISEYLKEVICRGWQAFYEIKDYSRPKNQSGGNIFLEIGQEEGIF